MKQYLTNLNMSKKLLLSPITVMLFLFLFGVMAYIGLVSQKSAINDIYNNKFKNYETVAQIVNDIANVHANVYKVISWTNANYEAAKIEALGKEQLATLNKTIENVKKKDICKGYHQRRKEDFRGIACTIA